ncbi:MAG TPA: dephospho-CoA kinase [Candidatus Phocaeicola caecigallinarum]|uniref:dephospho-CoA kinase n=1 Tax=Bacteroides TaxID=816 RepID=UPI000B37233C|nr:MULTISPECIES: dephospho-CoA kinase [Bacteroides]MBM6659439.1 dephospho-CoA kinase [Bacteroides gallinaceum]MDN0065191.1 dephospho-CoA kinase [Bacteroides gallinaceum]OUP29228.1 dephospho-CoA kinase [Bacteroides sp. An19]HJD11636.1 dephospho-CoA kinase [Candidatus Phocaeicola caecigallinarum]
MVKIGITGGIGSGKSYVSRLLTEHYGIPVYNTDSEAKRLMLSDEGIRRRLTALLGKEVYKSDGTLNKPLLANYLFADSCHAGQINAIVHPQVKADFLKWADLQTGCEIVALESAILFESGFDNIVDKVVMVYAPVELRIRRVMLRDSTTEEKIRQRIVAQMDDKAKQDRSDFIIFNDGSRPLNLQLDDLQETLEKMIKGNG